MTPLYAEKTDRRDKIQVYADIINVARRPVKITRIMRLANVQYNQFKEYVEKLCSTGFLEKSSIMSPGMSEAKRTSYTYKATDMGVKWCKLVSELYAKLEQA